MFGNGAMYFGVLTTGGTLVNANNGLSLANPTTVVLGQNDSATGNPAIVTNNREIPLNSFDLKIRALALGQWFMFHEETVGNTRFVFEVQSNDASNLQTWITFPDPSASVIPCVGKLLGQPDQLQFFEIGGSQFAIFDFATGITLFNGIVRTNLSFQGCFPVLPVVTTPYVIADFDSPGYLTNEGAGMAIQLDLQGFLIVGHVFTVIVHQANTITIQLPAGQTLRSAATVTSAGGTAFSNVVGNTITIVRVNSTQWFATAVTGVWTFT